jgi:hypothetical protein
MYIQQDPVPVLEANRFSHPMQRWQPQGVRYAGLGAMFDRPSMKMMRYPKVTGPTWLLAGFGADMSTMTAMVPRGSGSLTPTQKKLCDAVKSRLANMPWVTSPECGICPSSAVSCPTPEEQGYILPESCPTCGEEKSGTAGGIAWWWILVAAAGGIAVGATAGYYSAKKPGPKVI